MMRSRSAAEYRTFASATTIGTAPGVIGCRQTHRDKWPRAAGDDRVLESHVFAQMHQVIHGLLLAGAGDAFVGDEKHDSRPSILTEG